MEQKKTNNIACDICHAQFEPIWEGSEWHKQGDGCAASVKRRILSAYYGSSYDEDTYELIEPTLGDFANPVCDGCIKKWIELGWIKKLDPTQHHDLRNIPFNPGTTHPASL